MRKKMFAAIPVVLVMALLAASAQGEDRTSTLSVPLGDFSLAAEPTEEPQICSSPSFRQAGSVPACTTCGIDSWCDQWCGSGLGRCAPNSTCGSKKYCYCAGDLEN